MSTRSAVTAASSSRVPTVDKDRPKLNPQTVFEFGDGGNIRPARTVDEVFDGRSINSSRARDLAKTAIADRVDKANDNLPRDFGGRIIQRQPGERFTMLSWGETSWARRHAESLVRLIGRPARGMSVGDAQLLGGTYHQCSKEARLAMYNYSPDIDPVIWNDISAFVNDVVSVTAPHSAYSAERMMTTTTSFVEWTSIGGLPLDAKLLFRRKTIEAFTQQMAKKKSLSHGTLRNYRSMLLRISEVLNPELNPSPMKALNDRSSVPPYAEKEKELLQFWAHSQRTDALGQKARAMLSLAAGAGLRTREIAQLRKKDVLRDGEGILLTVTDHTGTRLIPMLARWEPMLGRVVEEVESDEAWVFGSASRGLSKNMLSKFAADSEGAIRPRVDRLRATWLVDHLQARTNMRALMIAAGISKFENLTRYLQYIPELDSREYRSHLRLEANS